MKSKKLKVYEIIVKCGAEVNLIYKLACSRQEAAQCVLEGYEIIRITEVTNDFPIDSKAVYKTLRDNGYGEVESAIILQLLDTLQNAT